MENSLIPFMEPQFQNLPYMTLKEGVEKCIREISDSDKGKAVKIITSPTGVGKSQIQDTLLREYIGKYLSTHSGILLFCINDLPVPVAELIIGNLSRSRSVFKNPLTVSSVFSLKRV